MNQVTHIGHDNYGDDVFFRTKNDRVLVYTAHDMISLDAETFWNLMNFGAKVFGMVVKREVAKEGEG